MVRWYNVVDNSYIPSQHSDVVFLNFLATLPGAMGARDIEAGCVNVNIYDIRAIAHHSMYITILSMSSLKVFPTY